MHELIYVRKRKRFSKSCSNINLIYVKFQFKRIQANSD